MTEIRSKEEIIQLVDSFYDKVRKDSLLAPVFNSVVKDWDEHLPKMYRFWETILLNKQTYNGSPFPKHVKLNIGKQHFERWVALFEKNIQEQFIGKVAEEAIKRAQTMGQIFAFKIESIKPQGNP